MDCTIFIIKRVIKTSLTDIDITDWLLKINELILKYYMNPRNFIFKFSFFCVKYQFLAFVFFISYVL